MNKKKKVSLFGEDEPDDHAGNGLDINKGYAQNYDNWRRLEEMQKIKDKYGDDDDSSSSESEPEWTEETEMGFLKTLGALKAKDMKCFENGKSFFTESDATECKNPRKKKDMKKEYKKMTIKDYERKLVLEKGGQIDESDEEAEIRKTYQRGYHEEQEDLRKSLVEAIHNDGDSDSEDFLTERKKTSKEIESEDADMYEWMKTADEKADKKKAKELKHLKKFWKDEEHMNADDKFLRDYLINKDYQPGENEENPTYEDIVALEEDDKDLEQNRQYEHKYNFRFEDPDQEFIKQYPRTVAESMRTDDSNRKDKRHEREERKKREKDEKKRELADLKKMKRHEIEQKLGKLRKAAGVEIPLTLDELNADFDPKEFDKKMESIFNDKYYGVEENVHEDDDEKPVFSDMDDSDYEDYDNLDVEELKKEGIPDDQEKEEEVSEGLEDEEDEKEEAVQKSAKSAMKNGKFDMVTAAQNAMNKDKNDNRRKSKRNALKEALAKKKPLFNPKEKTFEEYFDEYYALDYEDIIGDTPTRFKYREVEANNFGLTAEEILEADERQLNAWASLKKVTAYRTPQEEYFDRKAYQRKAEDVQKKQRILSIDFGGKKSLKRKAEDEEIERRQMAENEEEPVDPEDQEKKKKKKKRAKKKAKVVIESSEEVVEEGVPEMIPQSEEIPEKKEEEEEEVATESSEKQTQPPARKARKRNKNKHNVIAEKFGVGMTDSRVKAYGLNPSRLKKGLVYGK